MLVIFLFIYIWTEPTEVEGGDEGVHLLLSNEGNFRGKFNGEALVELKSEEDLEEALKKNKEHMGKRYVEGKIISSMVSYNIQDAKTFINM